MKKLLFLLGLIVSITSNGLAQAQVTKVTFFGSSVCKGSGAENNQGYAWQFFHSGVLDTFKYKYINASRGGDNTIKIERDNRMGIDLFSTKPDIVVIGLSLGNEGLTRKNTDNDREQVLEQYRSRLLAMADSLHSLDMHPVIVNCYANSRFEESHYNITKRMNQLINTWKYPSVNVLGTIDDFEGKWVDGFEKDPLHPNTAGHEEMSYALVPTLFDAIVAGKKTPGQDWNRSYSILMNTDEVEDPLSMEVKHMMHSFTLSFRFKETSDGGIAGINSNKKSHTINVFDSTIQYKTLSTTFPKHQRDWTHVVLSHSYANQKSMLYVNGKFVGSVDEQLAPTKIKFGGNASITELKDLTLHRSSLNGDEARDLYNKKFIQSSLEFYNPLTKSQHGNNLKNHAQSMTEFMLSNKVVLKHELVEF